MRPSKRTEMRVFGLLLVCAILPFVVHTGPLNRSTATPPAANGTSPEVPLELVIIGAYREGLKEDRKAGIEYEKSHGCYGHYLRGFKAGEKQTDSSRYWEGHADGYNEGLKFAELSSKLLAKCDCQNNISDIVGYTAAGIVVGLIAAFLLLCLIAWFAEKAGQKRDQLEKKAKIAPANGESSNFTSSTHLCLANGSTKKAVHV
ncbi:hypothetical protein M3Y99_01391000 [Aphelenchoides fujianensis]|nr:hypothetical protein M3Y99_01391000 [Aphelenchoides fujianensis]